MIIYFRASKAATEFQEDEQFVRFKDKAAFCALWFKEVMRHRMK